MTPAQFENWLESSVKEFDATYKKLTKDRPAKAMEFYIRARTYESLLTEFKKISWHHLNQ